ncbi:DNRLRE domain-containing protein [Streptomyces virginiae]|uniref:DNRLRE domain-containing protein n=1 Tax=Streptomyces virginiae TaxID=1961 RepID=UPI0035DB7426
MSVSESVDERPPTAADKQVVGTPARPWFRRRRALGGLAALLAAAVAIPVGVHVTGSGKAPSQPDKDVPVAANEARRTAQETGKEVEATAERSANTTTFARPDGTFRKQIYSSAVRAKVDGEWKPIDTTLQRVKDGYAAKAVNGRVVFSAGSQQGDTSERASRAVTRVSLGQDTPTEVWTDLVRLNTDGHDLAVSWPGPLPQPVIDGPRALYENVRPGVDLLMTAEDGGYSHLLVVKDKQAAADPLLGQLKYRLASPDLTFHLDTQSSAVSARDGEGEEIAGSPTPMMWDSSGKVTTTDNEPAWKPTDTAQQHPTLALPGLAGAEGARLKPATAALADNTLSVTPDASLLNAAETVYPVFIDPSFNGRKHAWSLLYKTEGNSSFYNGQNYNASGTSEARVGYESTSGGTSRSIFNFDFGSQLHGVGIDSAVVRALQTYSWSCSQKQMDIYSTPYVTSSSTWNNTSGWWTWKVATEMAGYGYNSSCPDNWIAPDIKGLVTHAANNGWGALSLGFAAPNESDSYYWKKFIANGETAPYIEVFYHTPPDVPLAMNMQTSPGGPCLTNGAGTAIGKTDVTFQVKGVDRDDLPQRQNLHQVQIEVWNATTGAPVYNKWLDVNSEGVVTATVPVTSFDDGQKYYWLARAKDIDGWWSPGSGPLDSGGGGWCTLTVSHTIPPNPVVDSAAFPPHGDNYTEWSVQPASTPGQKITFKGNGAKPEDIREYQWSLNRPLFDQKAAPNAAGEAEVSLQVDTAGPNVLYARTVSKSGNISNSTLYKFLVKPQAGQDKPGDVTGDGHPDLLAIDADGNLLTYAGDQIGDTDYYMLSAVQNGLPATGYWKTQNEIPALIGHSTDWFPGDGLTDLIARMPDGKLYVYPGLGNRAGQFDVDRRMEILLPASAPSPATFRQIVVSEDVDGDGFADLFALDTAGGFWIFSGYTGGSFTSYKKLAGVVWTPRDLIGVRDVTGDKVPDLLFRDNANASRGILLRKGKPGANGGVDLQSIAASIDSDGGQDYTYATTGWGRVAFPKILGTADATGDGIPDIWAVDAGGKQWLYQGRAGAIGPASGVDEDGWNSFLTIG